MILARCAVLAGVMIGFGSDAAVAQTYPFEGRWAQRAQYCGNRSTDVEDPTRLPMTLTASGLEDGSSSCSFESVTRSDANGWRVIARCATDGERYRNVLMLRVQARRLLLRWDGTPMRFVRCSR